MKNIPFLGLFIVSYVLLGRNFIVSHARSVRLPSKVVAECLDRTDITIEELIRLRDTTEESIKLINGDGDFRRYGCFLACVMKERGTMTSSTLYMDTIAGNIDKRLDSNFDVKSILYKTIEMCANTFHDIEDECEVALAFKVCTLKSMRNTF